MGAVFQQKRKDKHDGNTKESKNQWIKLYQHGRAFNENSDTDKCADSANYLKLREGEAAKGKPPKVDRVPHIQKLP